MHLQKGGKILIKLRKCLHRRYQDICIMRADENAEMTMMLHLYGYQVRYSDSFIMMKTRIRAYDWIIKFYKFILGKGAR